MTPRPDDVDPVGSFIRQSIEELQTEPSALAFDEEMLRRPLSVLPPAVPVTVETPVSALEAIQLMHERHIGCVLVVRGGKLKGIFTDRDVVARIVAARVDAGRIAVRRVMTARPECLRPSDSIAFALNLMALGGYRHIPLIDKAGAPVGVVSVKDIIAYLVGFFPKSVLNLPPRPRANYVREREGA